MVKIDLKYFKEFCDFVYPDTYPPNNNEVIKEFADENILHIFPQEFDT